MDRKEILNRYTPRILDDDQLKAQSSIRKSIMDLTVLIDDNLEDCREKSLAFTKLEEVLFFVNAGIARH